MDDLAKMVDFSGQVVFVTGASRGIGLAVAHAFAAQGARVVVSSRKAEACDEAVASIRSAGGEAIAVPAHAGNLDDLEALVAATVDAFGGIDVLVNNAGLIDFGPLHEIAPVAWDRVIGANLTGAYLCSRAVAPHMQRQKGGRIVNITSVSAQTGGVSGGVHYTASKGGLAAMTKTLARDLAPHGIAVNAISPGQIDADPELLTPEQREKVTAMIPLGRLGEPEEIAYAAVFLASPLANYITGTTLDVNGGILKR